MTLSLRRFRLKISNLSLMLKHPLLDREVAVNDVDAFAEKKAQEPDSRENPNEENEEVLLRKPREIKLQHRHTTPHSAAKQKVKPECFS